MNVKYSDAIGQIIAKEDAESECFGAGKTIVFFFKAPVDGSNYLNYNNYKLSFSVSKPKYKDKTKSVNVITDVQPTECSALVQNLGKTKLSTINLTFCFYDASGNFICARNQYIKEMEPNTTVEAKVTYMGKTSPTTVKVYKNWAY